jgi:hypothetical protein
MAEEPDRKTRDLEKKLFAGLMASRPLPIVPDPAPIEEDEALHRRHETSQPNSAPSLAQGLLEELMGKGMSREDAEAFLRRI